MEKGKWHLTYLFAAQLLSLCFGQRHNLMGHHNCSSYELPELLIDTAYLNVSLPAPMERDVQLQIWSQSIECQGCDLQFRANISHKHSPWGGKVCLFDTQYGTKLELLELNLTSGVLNSIGCSFTEHFEEGFMYEVMAIRDCQAVQKQFYHGEFLKMLPFGPILVAFLVFVGMSLMWLVLLTLHRRRIFRKLLSVFRVREEYLISNDLGSPTSINPIEEGNQPVKKQRLKSLDTFRGLCIVIMIFVNYGGGKYWFFHHSTWNGLTVADLVFPWFMFIMGTSMALSFRALLRNRTSRFNILLKIARRTLILFVLGMILGEDGGHLTDLHALRIPGVLQRFAIAYLVNALLELCFAKPRDPDPETPLVSVRDIVDFWPEWLLNLGFVATWLLITFKLPVPGCPTGYLGPGGLHDGGKYENCTGGAAKYIDKWFFGEKHIYGSPTCQELYHTKAHDPEGILGSLNSIFMTFLGLQMGKILLYFPTDKQRIKRFIVWGVLLGSIAAALCYGKKEGGVIPINKNLWSLSFVLCLAGMANLLFAVFYIFVDVLHIWNGAPFYYPGMNSILVYTLHITYQQYFPVQWSVPIHHSALLAMHLWGVALWCIVAFYCHSIGFFVAI